jgi:spore coat protein A, manganese oxidase
MSSRREFLFQLAGVSLSSQALKKFVDPLPIPARAVPTRGRTHYRIPLREFQAKVHRDLPPTTFWGYGGTSPGPIFEVRSGEAITVEWVNQLPSKHLFPVDHTLHGAEESNPDVRNVVHLHGGKVPPDSDGDPERWFVPGQSKLCHYPNRQDAATLFYHDHTMGITRLNAAAGLFGMYLIRDAVEGSLHLPEGKFEIPLILYDRLFGIDGQLQYPVSPDHHHPWTSEFFGNSILINGKLFPQLEVEPRQYRFRILNSSNSGFYTLSFSKDNLNLIPGSEAFQMIGSDQGLLAAPVSMKSLALAPAERADVVMDFSGYAGQSLYLKHAAAPVMQVRVSSAKPVDSPRLPAQLRGINRMPESAAVKTRELTLVDYKDSRGRATSMLLNGMHYSMPVTETPVLNTTEIWTLINLTDDTHPIHLHLVRFQILDRRRFDVIGYKETGRLSYTGPAVAPEAHEMGWKDTVRADVLLVTRIIVRFEGYTGRYVWHCHVLEHEDNEMMRPYEVIAPGPAHPSAQAPVRSGPANTGQAGGLPQQTG